MTRYMVEDRERKTFRVDRETLVSAPALEQGQRARREGTDLKIAERRAILEAEELGAMGAVSFIP
jgi:hypothetical protein